MVGYYNRLTKILSFSGEKAPDASIKGIHLSVPGYPYAQVLH